MRHLLYSVVICVALGIGTFMAQTQAPQTQPPPTSTSADPYANNAAPGTTTFPLAAPRDGAASPRGQIAEPEVLGHAQRRDQREVLVYEAESQRAGLARLQR